MHSRCLEPWELLGIPRGWGWGWKKKRGEEEPAPQADSWRPEKEENPGAKRNRKHTAGSNAAKRSSAVRMENCPLGVAARRPWVTLT